MPTNPDVLGSTVETIILKLLSERAMYGYEIIKVVNDRTDGAFAWKEGTLYPCLHKLEGQGIITADWQDGPLGKARKYYHLTRKGHAVVSQRIAEWQTYADAMNAVLFSPAT